MVLDEMILALSRISRFKTNVPGISEVSQSGRLIKNLPAKRWEMKCTPDGSPMNAPLWGGSAVCQGQEVASSREISTIVPWAYTIFLTYRYP
jgi:hypothetical protein